MQERMQRLKDMQELDVELNALRQNREQISSEQAVLGAEVERIQAMVDSLDGEIDKFQAQRRELSQALAIEQENVKKAEGRLPTIKTQKEYVAVLKEIDTAKKLNKDIQERIQATDKEIEGLTRDRAEKAAELAALDEKVAGRRAEIAADLEKFDQSLKEKSAQREELLKGFPHVMRKRYLMLLERRGGVAIVEARRGTCLGCNMQLPPQLFNSLFSSEEINSCPHCNRLLYVIPEA